MISNGQSAIGEWQNHLPFNNIKQIVEIKDKIYASTHGGGIFYHNKKDNSLHPLTKVEGLNDVGISTYNYYDDAKILMIGYENANIDLITAKGIYNFPDIMNKTSLLNKTIYDISFWGDYAYLSCGFGIVVFDYEKKEFKEQYYIGENGQRISVYDLTADGKHFYAATENGLFKAEKNNTNLVDYQNWHKIVSGIPTGKYTSIEKTDSLIIACHQNENLPDNIVFLKNNKWDTLSTEEYINCKNITYSHNKIIIQSDTLINIYNQQLDLITSDTNHRINDAIYDKDGQLWYGHESKGLSVANGTKNNIFLNGPAYNQNIEITSMGSTVLVAGDVIHKDKNYLRGYGLYLYRNGTWKNFLSHQPFRSNFRSVAIDPRNETHFWGGTRGYGISEYKDNKFAEHHDNRTSDIESIAGNPWYFSRVEALKYDQRNNLWFTVDRVENPLYVFKNNKELIKFTSLDYTKFDNQEFGDLATQGNHVWLLMNLNDIGIYALNHKGTIDDENDDEEKFFSVFNQDDKKFDVLNCMTTDLDGNIWIGTGEGPVVYYNPDDVHHDDDYKGYQIKIPRNDGSGLADYMLGTESINSIAVDGANRKWFGTEGSGVYLFSADGNEQLHHFDKENSPLLSNHIRDIGINEESGEVFFGTDKGMVSFRGDATKAYDDFENVYAYPNPVRSDYDGLITITGLANGTNVKITDLAGQIVYEQDAIGGQVSWDATNPANERIHSGIYQVYCATKNGAKHLTTKILFIQ